VLRRHDRPQLVIPAVPWPEMPNTIRSLVSDGFRVLAETPPAPDLDGLRSLWADVGGTGMVQVAEQYTRMPAHACSLALVADRVIGDVTSVQISSTHLYHAVSLIRHLLTVGFMEATVSAREFTAPLVDPLTPAGWTDDPTPKPATTTLATIDFGGRSGLYDFTDNQWWNPLRSRRIVIRGSLGEIVDDRVIRMLDPRTPLESQTVRRRSGIDLNLEGNDLQQITFEGRVLYRNPFEGYRFSEDDIAVAAILEAAGAWARDEGPAPYPLAEGLQDHLISLAIGRSASTGQDILVGTEAWAS
jgi:predicted dehydrogenase